MHIVDFACHRVPNAIGEATSFGHKTRFFWGARALAPPHSKKHPALAPTCLEKAG
jgi:hypothetical protein